jgi:hypothetical protein
MASANRFQIQIVALDKATAVFRKVNTSMADAMRPATRLQRQIGALSKEVHLDKLVKGFNVVTRSADKVADSLGLAVPQLEALTGLGAAGGVVATLTAAAGATALFTKKWADSGAEILQTSQALGVNAQELQIHQKATAQALVSAEDFTASLANLQGALHKLQYDGDATLQGLLTSWGIALKTDKDGVIDLLGMFDQLTDKIATFKDPATRAQAAQLFGLDRVLPYVNMGPKGMHSALDEQRKLAPPRSNKSLGDAMTLEQSLAKMKTAVDAIFNNFGDKTGPAATRMVQATTAAIAGDGKQGAGSSLLKSSYLLGPLGEWSLYQAWLMSRIRGGPATPAEAPRHRMSGLVTPDPAHADHPLIGGRRVDPGDQLDRDEERLGVLMQELAGERDAGNRAALQREIDGTRAKIGAEAQRVKVDVTFTNAPPGTTARISNGFGEHRISHISPDAP